MKLQNKSIKSLILLLLAFNNSFSQQSNKWLDSISNDYISKHNIVGMNISVIDSDSIYYGVSGIIKQNHNQKIKLNNNFFLASLSKSFTSLIAKKMEEDNLISFNTKFFDVFPELLEIKNSKKYAKITLGDLLSHKARINDFYLYDKTKVATDLKKTNKRYQLTKLTLKKARKSKNTYSNVGYIMAGLMLEKKAGIDFELLIRNTLESLSLNYIVGYPNTHNKNDTWGHNTLEGQNKYKLSDFNYFSEFQLPCWGLSMSILDYSSYVQLHLNGLLGKSNYLKSDSYKQLHNTFKKLNYGWETNKLSSLRITTHDGSGDVFFGRTIIIPSEKVAVVVLFNQTATSIKKLNEFIEFIIKNYKEHII